MRAAILNGYHKNGDTLAVCDIPVPQIEDHEVLVKIKAAGVNSLDNMIIRGEVILMVPYKFPLIMGNEICGVVDKIYELSEVNQALAKVAGGGSKGKTILKIS